MAQAADDTPLLELRQLRCWYPARGGLPGRVRGRAWIRAVEDVSFAIRRGETFGLVGESGCGKTTLARTILRLETARSGQVLFDGEDLLALPPARLREVRAEIQAVFQDPQASLDPRMSIRQLVGEGLALRGVGRAVRETQVAELLERVGLRRAHLDRYPHEFSGGQRQRIGIARALALQPRLVVADEPVSALDLSVQSQVLNLLSELQRDFGLTYLFISHDLAVIEYLSDRVGVMYLGRLVELADTASLFARPRMPYTKALLSANPETGHAATRIVLRGEVPSPLAPPSGCPFRTRCWMAQAVCAETAPELREVAPGHLAACHFAEDV